MKIKRYAVVVWEYGGEVEAYEKPHGEWCSHSEVDELEQENARLKLKLHALADEASRCRASVSREGRYCDHERLVNAITEAREEERRA